MADTTYSTSTEPIDSLTPGAPRIAGTAVACPPTLYNQDDVAREFTQPESTDEPWLLGGCCLMLMGRDVGIDPPLVCPAFPVCSGRALRRMVRQGRPVVAGVSS